jgi:plastocyanin
MSTRSRSLGGAALLLLASLAIAPTVAAGDPCYHGYSMPPSTTASTTTVKLEPCAFAPTIARVATGSTLTFVNTSGDVHLLTGANQAWGDRDREIPAGGSVTVTFDSPGVYPFSCSLHRGMSGAVIVGDADGEVAAAAPVSSGGGGADSGPLMAIAIVGLAGLAALGWAAALLQRRRPAPSEAPRVPAA